jgi:hypothetical protein
MTPEDIEQLKQLKALKDDGVITEAEFETQKQLLLNPDFVEPDLKSTSALEPESEKLHVPSEEPRPNIFVGSGGGGSPTSVEKPKGNSPLKIFAAIFAIAALVAIGVVVFGGSDDSRSSKADDSKPSTPISSPATTETPTTEASEEVELVNEANVFEWYFSMVVCANETLESLPREMSTPEWVEAVPPSLSYSAGVLLRVAELVESRDWPSAESWNQSELDMAITEMAQLLTERSQVFSMATRTSPEAWNDVKPLLEDNNNNFNARVAPLSDEIFDLLGGFLFGGAGSWCDVLSRYEENPPDFSYFRPEKNFTDEFWDYDLRQVCGMLRDLEVPNGNNPEANINYLSAQAQRLYEKLQNDELYDLDQSRFYYLGIDLVVTMEVFAERSEQYMPMSHLSAVGNCENLGW